MDEITVLFFVLGIIVGTGLGWLLQSVQARQSPPLTAAATSVQAPEPHVSLAETAAVQQQLQQSRYLLQNAPIGYIQVDEESQLVWCNARARKLLGLTEADTAAVETPRLLLEWVRSYELDQLIDQTRQTQTAQQQDWVLHLVSPDPIHPKEDVSCPLRGYGLPLAQGQVGVFLENRQEAVILAQQRDRWTSDVAHELKTPLTSIRLVAETLKTRVDETSQAWLERLLNEILRLGNLVEDLLNLSRLESRDDDGLKMKPVELPQLVFAAWQSLEPLAQVKQLELVYDGPQELLVSLDETLMYRVFINLLDNAIKYSPSQQTVWVKVAVRTPTAEDGQASAAQVCLDFIDQGPGFRAVDLPHIFSRFYRADPARSREASANAPTAAATSASNSGTGLGLAIVQQIVAAHQGVITAKNHPETGGGWLTLCLPMQPETAQPMLLANEER